MKVREEREEKRGRGREDKREGGRENRGGEGGNIRTKANIRAQRKITSPKREEKNQ